MSLTLGVCTVGKQKEHTLIAKIGETAEIRHLPIHRCIVELEVTRMNNHPHGRLDRESDRIGNGVVHADKSDAETTNVDDVPCHDGVQIGRVHPILLQASLQYAERQTCTIHGAWDLLHHIRESTNMILMPMRQYDRLNHVTILDKVSNIGNDEINPQHIFLREHQPGIHHEDLIIHADSRHILSDLTQPAQRDNLYLLSAFSMVAITIERQKNTPP